MNNQQTLAYVRTQDAPKLPPPPSTVGLVGWLWQNILSSMLNFSSVGAAIISVLTALLTIGSLYIAWITISGLVQFTLIDATFSDPTGIKREACLPNDGACWPFLAARLQQYVYGFYPDEELWRVNIVYLVGAIGIAWMVIERLPHRKLVAAFMLLVFPVMTFILLTGGNLTAGSGFWVKWPILTLVLCALAWAARSGWGGVVLSAFAGTLSILAGIAIYVLLATAMATTDLGLATVPTHKWGGLLVTLVVAITGIVASLPLGILLALGRRSTLPVIRMLSVIFIEFWRGVPLITVLFMSSVMLPFFLPPGVEFNKLLRALIGVALFSSAYMSEVIRGGLQAIPKGQFEGAQALGLPYWNMMRLIVLPQALVLVIPGIVNTFIGLFKDTTLVLIIGLFDLLGAIQSSFAETTWATPVTSKTGYLFAATVFFLFCYGMSRYSRHMEMKLRRGHKR